MIATSATAMGARSSAHQKLPVILITLSPQKAPSMKKEPWARFTTPMRPKISDNPDANKKSSTP